MKRRKIVIDGVIYQLQKNRKAGISKVWNALLNHLAYSDIAEDIILLDRDNSLPSFPNLQVKKINRFEENFFDSDYIYLQEVLENIGEYIFVSTYFTAPEKSPSILMIHDMIPEMMGINLASPMWQAKERAIEFASAYLAVSESTAHDFAKIYPQLLDREVFVLYNSTDAEFQPRTAEEIELFKETHGIKKPYFVFVGSRLEYKNAGHFFKAFSLLPKPDSFEIVCVSGISRLESIYQKYVKNIRVHNLPLNEKDLSIALAGAAALVYPSLYEGFGLPVLEGLKSGCPVITTKVSSLPEVGGDAALYVEPNDVIGLKEALLKVLDKDVAKKMIQLGFEHAEKFSWQITGDMLVSILKEYSQKPANSFHSNKHPYESGPRMVYHLSKDSSFAQILRLFLETISLSTFSKPLEQIGKIEENATKIQLLTPQKVFETIEHFVKLDECDNFLRYWYGLLLEKQGRGKEALNNYMTALKAGELSGIVAIAATRLAISLESYSTASTILSGLLRIYPNLNQLNEWNQLIQAKIQAAKEEMHLNQITLKELEAEMHFISSVEPAEFESKNHSVAIVVPTKGRPLSLSNFLNSVPTAIGSLTCEIIVVTPRAEIKTVEKLKLKGIKTTILADEDIFNSGEKFNWSKLMQVAFGKADAEYLMYGSDDIVFHSDAVINAISLIDMAKSKGEKVGGVTFVHRNTIEDYGGIFKYYGYDSIDGFNFINFGLISKEAFQATAGFDKNYSFYWADVDICMQIWSAGYTIINSNLSIVEHNNLVDAIRKDNAGDVYLLDTLTFAAKWKNREMFKGKNPLKKIRAVFHSEKEQKAAVSFVERNNTEPDTSAKIKQPEVNSEVNEVANIVQVNEPDNSAILKVVSEKSEYLVSAIVSIYNSEKFIEGCLEDLISQTLFEKGDLEIVLVDGGTEQDEFSIIKPYLEKYNNITFVPSVRKLSIYEAWNKGIKISKGLYLTNSNTDDRHKNDALEQMANIMQLEENVGLVYADCYKTTTMNDTFNSMTLKERIFWAQFDADLLLFGCFMGPQPMWRKTLHEKFGLFDESLKVVGDYEFWLRISRGTILKHIDKVLGLYYYSDSSAEHRNKELTERENFEVQKKYFSQYILGESDVKRIQNKIELIRNIKKDENYYRYATSLLERRIAGLTIQQKLEEYSEISQDGLSAEQMEHLQYFIEYLRSGEIFTDELFYLINALNVQGISNVVSGNLDAAKQSFSEVLQLDNTNHTAIKAFEMFGFN